jgi:branched-chain amino acid transport system ATP-binding protein
MFEIKKLFSGYEGLEILKGIDLEVKSGEIIAIIGPNGAGKSTILKSIFNLCDVTSGKIIWKNIDITKLKTHEKIFEGISYVPQGRQIFRNLTVHENLEMGAFMMKDKNLIETNIKYVYDKFPFLKKKENEMADNLSGGQQQMLAIGRALIQSPQLLLLDEPSLGLSPKFMNEIFKKIKEINKEGVSVIIVEQNAKTAVELADVTYIVENGKVVLKGGKEILKSSKIKKIFFAGK